MLACCKIISKRQIDGHGVPLHCQQPASTRQVPTTTHPTPAFRPAHHRSCGPCRRPQTFCAPACAGESCRTRQATCLRVGFKGSVVNLKKKVPSSTLTNCTPRAPLPTHTCLEVVIHLGHRFQKGFLVAFCHALLLALLGSGLGRFNMPGRRALLDPSTADRSAPSPQQVYSPQGQPRHTSAQSMTARLLPSQEKSYVPKNRTGIAFGRGGSSNGGKERSRPRVSTLAGHQG